MIPTLRMQAVPLGFDAARAIMLLSRAAAMIATNA
jgi:hypothetical protein